MPLYLCLLLLLLLARVHGEQPEERLFVAARRDKVFAFRVHSGGKHELTDTLHLAYRKKPRGICGDKERLYLSSGDEVICWGWSRHEVLWRTRLPGEPCDRLEVHDGQVFVPSGFANKEAAVFVVDGASGRLVQTIQEQVPGLAHNALVDSDTLAVSGRGSRWISLFSSHDGHFVRKIGPFTDNVRPFTVGAGSWYANVDNLLGFEVCQRGEVRRVEAPPARAKHPTHHECPSHGLGLTPDGRELWLVDSQSDRLLVYDTKSLELLDQVSVGHDPGWVNFSRTARWVYPSTGEVVSRPDRKVVGWLRDADGKVFGSEKVLPVLWSDGKPLDVGSQYGRAQH